MSGRERTAAVSLAWVIPGIDMSRVDSGGWSPCTGDDADEGAPFRASLLGAARLALNLVAERFVALVARRFAEARGAGGFVCRALGAGICILPIPGIPAIPC